MTEANDLDSSALSPEVADELEAARARALRFLSYRPRSIAEIRRYLRRKGVSEEVATRLIGSLESAGLLNDREFADYWVANRERFSPRGNRVLKQELAVKGIDRDTVSEALDALSDEEDRAISAARKKLRTLSPLDEGEAERRLVAFLVRRGFDFATARRVTSNLLEDERVDGATQEGRWPAPARSLR